MRFAPMIALCLGLPLLAACQTSDLMEPPVPLGEFALGLNVAVADNVQKVPISRDATPEDWEAAMKKANCLTCHTKDKKLVGPSFKDIAAKYKGQADAPAKLFDKVRKGGSGVFGPVPMAPNPPDKINDADLKSAVEFILKPRNLYVGFPFLRFGMADKTWIGNQFTEQGVYLGLNSYRYLPVTKPP